MRIIMRQYAVLILICILGFATLLTGCVLPQIVIPTPQTYQSSYDKVWYATLDTLNEMGYTTSHLKKEDGYIETVVQQFDTARYGQVIKLSGASAEKVKISIWISKENNGKKAKVKVTPYLEHEYSTKWRTGGREEWRSSWEKVESDGTLEKMVYDKIASKLR